MSSCGENLSYGSVSQSGNVKTVESFVLFVLKKFICVAISLAALMSGVTITRGDWWFFWRFFRANPYEQPYNWPHRWVVIRLLIADISKGFFLFAIYD